MKMLHSINNKFDFFVYKIIFVKYELKNRCFDHKSYKSKYHMNIYNSDIQLSDVSIFLKIDNILN